MLSPKPRNRSFCPTVDSLETIRLLAAGIAAPALVHIRAIIDLKPTPVGNDALNALLNSTPHTGRQKIVVNKLTGDPSTNVITGKATGYYNISVIGSIRATITFKSNVDKPKNKDVQVSVDRFSSFLTSSTKLKVQKAVVSFLQRDHDKIVALLHPPTA